MKNRNCLTSLCRYCRYYELQGRRGGYCQILDVPVQGSWNACDLAMPPFAPSWEKAEPSTFSNQKLASGNSESNHLSLGVVKSDPSLTAANH